MGNQMINYSVFMWKNPTVENAVEKAYAKNQVSEIWTLEKFAKHISDHNGVYSRGTVKGVISDMCECLVEQMLNGNKIQLGELGTFGISISSVGAESIEKFSSRNIKSVNILFSPGVDFENLISRAEFNLVASRTAQAATLKAEKAGETTVDLAAAKNKGTDSSTDPTDPNEPNDPSDSPVDPGTSDGGDDTPVDPGTSDGEGTGSGSGSTGGESGGKDPDFE